MANRTLAASTICVTLALTCVACRRASNDSAPPRSVHSDAAQVSPLAQGATSDANSREDAAGTSARVSDAGNSEPTVSQEASAQTPALPALNAESDIVSI